MDQTDFLGIRAIRGAEFRVLAGTLDIADTQGLVGSAGFQGSVQRVDTRGFQVSAGTPVSVGCPDTLDIRVVEYRDTQDFVVLLEPLEQVDFRGSVV